MHQLSRADRILLLTFLPLWLLVFGLQVRAIVSTGQAMPPLFAEPAASSDSYPKVGGVWPESGQLAPELRSFTSNRNIVGVPLARLSFATPSDALSIWVAAAST